jgi:Zn-dependent protease with chaperone function
VSRARYYDGKVAAGRDVVLTLATSGLTVADTDYRVIEIWPLADIARIDRDDTGVARITRKSDAAALLSEDTVLVAALRRHIGNLPRRGRRRVPVLVWWLTGAAASVVAFFWLVLPLLAGQVARAMPAEWEQSIGRGAAEQIAGFFGRRGGKCDDAAGRAALDRLVARLTSATPPRLPVNIRVVDTGMVNAFALPGGEVLLLRGLLDFVEHPNELAAVLAHEFAHGDLRHPTEISIKRGIGAVAVGAILGDVTGLSVSVLLAQALVEASYTRDAEAEADTQMIETMRRAGLQTLRAAEFFDRVAKKYGDAPGALALFSTHPDSAGRAQRLREAVPRGADVLSQADWAALKGICKTEKKED